MKTKEENTDTEESNSAEVVSEGNGKDTIPYPYRNLELTFSFVEKVYNELGHDIYHTREQIASVHNMAPNSIKQPLSCAQQFGLLEIKHGVGYKTTDLFAKIFLPVDDEEKKRSILESLRQSQLYNELFSTYEKSGILPNNAGLTNTLIRLYHFAPAIATKIAKDFVATLKNYGFLDDKNILKLNIRPQSASPSDVSNNKPSVGENNNTPKPNNPPNSQSGATIVIPLKNGRKASLVLPDDYHNRDLKRVIKFLTAIMDDPEDDDLEDTKIKNPTM
jgi:hypothetical protein